MYTAHFGSRSRLVVITDFKIEGFFVKTQFSGRFFFAVWELDGAMEAWSYYLHFLSFPFFFLTGLHACTSSNCSWTNGGAGVSGLQLSSIKSLSHLLGIIGHLMIGNQAGIATSRLLKITSSWANYTICLDVDMMEAWNWSFKIDLVL